MRTTPSETLRFDFSAMRQFRRAHEISQIELGRRSGLGRNTVNNIEKGVQEPSLRTVVLLARALGRPMHQLFTVVDDN